MSKKEIKRSKSCGNCGHVTYGGYYKYTCDGCGGSMTKKEVRDSTDFSVHTDSPDSETGSGIKELHFHSWHCLLEYVENLTEEDLKTHTCWSIWAHNSESIEALRNVLLKAKEEM